MKKFGGYFTRGEKILWVGSAAAILGFFFVFDRKIIGRLLHPSLELPR